MPLTPPKITIWRLMVAVAVAAVLTPFPFIALYSLFMTLLFVWLPILLIAWPFDGLFLGSSRQVKAYVALLAVPIGFVYFLIVISITHHSFEAIALSLMILFCAGPVYAAWRLRQGKWLTSGHVLWGWSGLVMTSWSFFALQMAYSPHGGWRGPGMVVELTRLTLVVAILSLYCPRPDRSDKGATRTHYIGWLLTETYILLWGWSAARILYFH